MNIDDIQRRIPHRPPFLWIDEVTEIGDGRIVARKFVDPKLDVFRGHYPDFPILPGVLQCEAAFQAGAILITDAEPVEDGRVPVVTRVNNVKFRRPILPGETMQIEARITEKLANAFFLSAVVKVDNQTATRLEFACTAATLDA
ncbi:MAG: 3-hydroxyacyl-ACP dehydratase FabZ family protein [Planctomycetaceae bacterium]